MPEPSGDDWVALSTEPLPAGRALDWVVQPSCGAVVLFTGTVRNHAPGRSGVSALTYEAYESQAVPRLEAVVVRLRRHHPMIGRVALLHRVGDLGVGDTAVVVAVSAPHRPEAFVAARHGIDAVKVTVPIWKRERWAGGEDWGTCSHVLVDVDDLPEPGPDGSLAVGSDLAVDGPVGFRHSDTATR